MATIILTLDGSKLAERAIPDALARCAPGDELVLFNVLEQPPAMAGAEIPVYPLDPAPSVAYLNAQAARIHREGVTIRTEVVPGIAATEILEAARRYEARLLVMASHGRTGVGRWLMGSVAERVVRDAPCPVWLVRQDAPSNEVKRVMIPLDPDDVQTSPLELLEHFVAPGSADVLLLSAANLDWIGADDLRRQLIEVMYESLDGPAAVLKAAGWRVQVRATAGQAASHIVQAAKEDKVDLILMSTHARHGMEHLWSGSVAEQVARTAPCPVVIVPPLAVPAQA